jgi:hypothetical protein
MLMQGILKGETLALEEEIVVAGRIEPVVQAKPPALVVREER